MRYLTAIKNSLVLLAIPLINSVGFAGYTSAMSTMSHEMGGMNHSSKDATSCATLCRTAVVDRDANNPIRSDKEDDDDEPVAPFYTLNQVGHINEKLVKQRLYANAIKPPPKVPIYILNAIFRV